MTQTVKQLMRAYGIDEKSLEVSPELLERIKADRQRYINALDDETIKNYTVDTKQTTKETTFIGTRYTKKQTNLSGRSLGRSSGPVKKSGANKRTGQGGEHGECLGASARTGWVGVDKFTIKHTPVARTMKKKESQISSIVALYDTLLEKVGQ